MLTDDGQLVVATCDECFTPNPLPQHAVPAAPVTNPSSNQSNPEGRNINMNTLQRRLAEKRANEEAGFTLIELLVVIVILGILAAVVVFSVRGISDRGNNSACEATRSAILTGAEAAYAQTGAYPASLAAMATAGFVSAGGGAIAANVFTGKNFIVTYTPGSSSAAPTAVGGTPPTGTAGCPA